MSVVGLMVQGSMSSEFETQGVQRGQEAGPDQTKKVRSLIRWVKSSTIALDKNPRGALNSLNNHSVSLLGTDYFTGQPHVVVVAPQLSTTNPENHRKATNLLVSKGLKNIYELEYAGKITPIQAEKMRMEMSVGHVGIDSHVQSPKGLLKATEPRSQTNQDGPRISNYNASLTQRWHREPLTRKQIVKKGIIIISGLSLAGCSVLTPSPTPNIPTATEPVIVETTEIAPKQESFGGSKLTGPIREIKKELANIDVLQAKIKELAKSTSEVGDRPYRIVGGTLVDINGNEEMIVFIAINDENGNLLTPTPEPQVGPTIKNAQAQVFMYTESDGVSTLVPAGEGKQEAGGRLIPMRVWVVNGTIFMGFVTPGVSEESRVPVFQTVVDQKGNVVKVTLIDPFSGKEFASNAFPDSVMKVLANMAQIETPTPPPTETATPVDVEQLPPMIRDYVKANPDAKYSVDAEGATHLFFTEPNPVSDEQKIKDLGVICKFSRCIHSDSEAIILYGRLTGDMEIIIDKNGVMELVTSADILNNLRGNKLQRIRVRFLLPERSSATYYYYRNMGLDPNINNLDIKTVLKLFKSGTNFGKIGNIYMNPSTSTQKSPFWKKYGYREPDEYLKQVQEWLNSGLDPAKDMDLIMF